MEKGKVLLRGEQFDGAESNFKQAVELCEAVYGKGSPESGASHTLTAPPPLGRPSTPWP